MYALKRLLSAIGLKTPSQGTARSGTVTARPGLAAGGRRPLWLAYSLPFITTAVTLLVVEAAARGEPVNTPVIVFVFPILLSAYAGGLVPGLLSTVLSTLATVYFVLPPVHSWSVASPVDNIKWITLAGAGTLISFLMAQRERQGVEEVAQHSAQAAGSLLSTERKVRAGFAVLLACLIAVAAVSYPALMRLRLNSAWVDHTHRVIASLRLLISSATDAETGERGYVITGKEEFLEPYHSGLQGVNHALSEARRLTKDNPEEQRRLDVLEPLVAERLAVLKEGIERRDQSYASAQAFVSSDTGKQVHDRIRGAVAEMEATEQALLAKREALEQHGSAVAKIEIVGGSALAILIVAAALWMIGKAFTASRGAETALQEAHDQLETRIKERTSELRTSEQRLRTVLDNSRDVIVRFNLQTGRYAYVSPSAEALVGYTPEAFVELPFDGEAARAMVHPDDLPVVLAAWARAEETGAAEVEYRQRKKNGEYVWIASRMSVSMDSAGRPSYRTSSLRDITERKRAEEALRESENQFRTLANAIPTLCWMANADGWITWYNNRWYEYTGTTPEQMEGWGWQSVHDPEVLPKVLETWKASLATGKAFEMVFPLRGVDGVFRPFLTRIVPLLDHDGRIVRWFGTNTDIAEQRRTEEALRASEQQLKHAQQIGNVGSWEWDVQTGSLRWSEQVYRQLGEDPATFTATHDVFLRRLHPEDRAAFEEASHHALAGTGSYGLELRMVRSDGTTCVLHTRGEVLKGPDGQPRSVLGVCLDITERKRAEEALRQSEQRLRLATQAARIGTFEWNVQTDLDTWTPEVEVMYGLAPGEFGRTGSAWKELLHPEDREATLNLCNRAFETGEPTEGEWRVIWPDGSVHWILGCFQAFKDAAGAPLGMTGANIDITERKRAEEALRESRAKLKAAFASMTEAIFIGDVEGRLIDCNEEFVRYHRFEDREECSRTIADCPRYLEAYFHDGTPAPPEMWAMPRALRGETASDVEYMLRRKDTGETWWGSYTFAPIEDEDGRIVGAVVAGREITERKRAEEALRKSEAKAKAQAEEMAALMEAVPVGIFKSEDTECRWMDGNRAAYEMLRRPRGSNLSKFGPEGEKPVNFRAMKDGKEIPLSELLMQEVAATGQAVRDHEMDLVFQDGVTVSIMGNVEPLLDESGRPRGVVGAFLDITEFKRAQEALRQRAEELETVMKVAPVAIWVANDPACHDIAGNPLANKLYEAAEGENVSAGPAPGAPVPPRRFFRGGRELAAEELPMQEAAARGEDMKGVDLDVLLPGGTYMSMYGAASPLRDAAGKVRGCVGAFLDITERKRAEETLARRAQDLARSNADLEQFAYVASHDLKEPLRAVSGSLGLLQRHYEGKLDDLGGVCIGNAIDGVLRMESLIDGLLAYSRVATRGVEFGPVESAEALGRAIQNLGAVIQESGTAITYDPLPQVNGDASQLVSLFQNLIGNALKFRKETPPHVHVSAERGNTFWRFAVRDNGIGIDPQHFEKIFRVFQRLHTRSRYPGTGIGLAICKKVVERHGGRIWVESAPGAGSTFYFTLMDPQANHREEARESHAESRNAA